MKHSEWKSLLHVLRIAFVLVWFAVLSTAALYAVYLLLHRHT